jgi:hypothetical protein
MTDEFEDPRKTALRERVAAAADAAGYQVDPDRPTVAYPTASGLKGSIKGDVYGLSSEGDALLFFVRPDGDRPLPQWLANHTQASFEIDQTEIYVVCEKVGPGLEGTCAAAGAGLLILGEGNTFEKKLEYGRPSQSGDARAFARRVKAVRSRFDSKLRLNLAEVDQRFQESKAITAGMPPKTRDMYLNAIERQSIAWRNWGDDLSARLDALAANIDNEALEEVEAAILNGPEDLDETP